MSTKIGQTSSDGPHKKPSTKSRTKRQSHARERVATTSPRKWKPRKPDRGSCLLNATAASGRDFCRVASGGIVAAATSSAVIDEADYGVYSLSPATANN